MPDGIYDQLSMLGIDPLQGRQFLVRKRDGRLEEFNEARIFLAIESAFKAVLELEADERLPDEPQAAVKRCGDAVTARVLGRAVRGEDLEVERIQDATEEQLMLAGHVEVARRFILYREERRQARASREERLGSFIRAEPSTQPDAPEIVPSHDFNFPLAIHEGQYLKLLAPELVDFDLTELSRYLHPERDALLSESGRRALHETYLLKDGSRFIEGIQGYWMRVAMGLALNEGNQTEARAVEFYEVLSTLQFLPSESILRASGSAFPLLALCQNVSSAGALDQVRTSPGSRATCVWLEPWHAGIFDFLRPHHTGQTMARGLWLPDLFLRRLEEKDKWTLFDPAETADLHSLHGPAFEERYLYYELMARVGKMQFFRETEADTVWREMLESIRTGAETIVGFKDAVNIRAARPPMGGIRHAGFGDGYLAAAPGVFGGINLPAFLTDDPASPLDLPLLRATVATVVRMLDNALDLSLYPSRPERELALANRIIGLAMHGLQTALERSRLSHPETDAVEFADRCAETVAWCAVMASAELAAERGPCPGFSDSKWGQGVMPFDTLMELDRRRAFGLSVDRSSVMDWNAARQSVLQNGLRHTSLTAGVSADLASLAGPADAATHEALDVTNLIDFAARKQKWIDMGQPFSFPVAASNVEELSRWYLAAWRQGLKSIRPPARVAPSSQLEPSSYLQHLK